MKPTEELVAALEWAADAMVGDETEQWEYDLNLSYSNILLDLAHAIEHTHILVRKEPVMRREDAIVYEDCHRCYCEAPGLNDPVEYKDLLDMFCAQTRQLVVLSRSAPLYAADEEPKP